MNGKDVTFADWAAKMKANFELKFWVPETPEEDAKYGIDKKLVHRRGIYKDVLGSTAGYTDYQLRPNVCVAMSYAPELFDRNHAKVCLENVCSILMEKGCMGIKTLDPKDLNYNGDYVSHDENDGHNYHQGPEWLWPFGFYLKAQLLFFKFDTPEDAKRETMKWLQPHREHIKSSKFMGLPELTNSHGSVCKDSCVTQAWSVSTVIDALRDLYYIQEE